MAKMAVNVEIWLVGDDGERLAGAGHFEMDLHEGVHPAAGMFEDGVIEAMKEAARSLEFGIEAAIQEKVGR